MFYFLILIVNKLNFQKVLKVFEVVLSSSNPSSNKILLLLYIII